jgi:hypothetical protein
MHRILGLAVYPLKLIRVNPLPKGWLPKASPAKAKGYLYPDDDAKLLACQTVPLCLRLFYGFLDREGPRFSEAVALDIADFNLAKGAVDLDKNKTDDPRTWALDQAVVLALRAWVARREAAAGAPLASSTPMFVDEEGKRLQYDHQNAKRFRAHLRAAGLEKERPDLFERSASRMHIRLHDLRATFVTLSLANGKTETWVADRTGHKSSDMINKYRRAARTAAELNLGPLRPLNTSIPELACGGTPGVGDAGTPGAGGAGTPGDASGSTPPPPVDPHGEVAARAQACAHADLNVVDRDDPSSQNPEKHDTSRPDAASLNPLIVVRVHAPEQARRAILPCRHR